MPSRPLPGLTVWLTGLPGSGKTTMAAGLAAQFDVDVARTFLLDGDTLRKGLNADLGYTKDDRFEAVRRAGELAVMLSREGMLTIVSLVSPYSAARGAVRRRHEQAGVAYLEAWVSAPLAVCEARDPKQLYRRARMSELTMMTGINDPYEPPIEPDIELPTHLMGIDEAVACLSGAARRAWDRRTGGSTR